MDSGHRHHNMAAVKEIANGQNGESRTPAFQIEKQIGDFADNAVTRVANLLSNERGG